MPTASPTDGPARERPNRLDSELVRRGLARSRGHAQELIDAGAVTVLGVRTPKASTPVSGDTPVQVDSGGSDWVGRAAYKLLAALDTWEPQGLHVAARRCADVGASTGGFTQVLLGRGAADVAAIDVGHGQLAPCIAADPRVRELSGVNIRDADPAMLGAPFDVVVADLSFISLTLVVARLAALAGPTADVVLLVKPQFEVGRARLGKGGIVRSASDRAAAVRAVMGAAQSHGLAVIAGRPSPVTGTGGNREYLVWVTARPVPQLGPADLERLVADMLDAELTR